MKVLVEVPIGLHSDLLGRCNIESPEYLMLRNGVIGLEDRHEIVSILCDDERAKQIITLANRYAPLTGNKIVVKPAPKYNLH